MQSFLWEEQYTGVFVRWCIGYLSDKELIAFLKQAAIHLYKSSKARTRGSNVRSLILVMENVAPPGETLGPFDGQITRNEKDIERVFGRADLSIYDKSDLTVLHKGYRPVRVWALY